MKIFKKIIFPICSYRFKYNLGFNILAFYLDLLIWIVPLSIIIITIYINFLI